jgi:hypothetical protein
MIRWAIRLGFMAICSPAFLLIGLVIYSLLTGDLGWMR